MKSTLERKCLMEPKIAAIPTTVEAASQIVGSLDDTGPGEMVVDTALVFSEDEEDVDSGVEGDTAENPIEYGAQQDVGDEAAVPTGVDPDDADAEDLLADRLAIPNEKAELDDCEGDDEERVENRKKTDGEAADQQGHGKGTRSPQGTVDDGGGEAAAARLVDQVVEVDRSQWKDRRQEGSARQRMPTKPKRTRLTLRTPRLAKNIWETTR